MPASFSELLQNIDAQNKAQRQQMWNQIAPYLQVFHKQAVYNSEKKKLAEGLGTIAKGEGWDFTIPGSEAGLPSPELMQTHFASQQRIQLQRQQDEQWFKSTGQPMPENWQNLTPQERVVVKGKAENDFSYNTAVNDLIAAYPEVKAKLPADFDTLQPSRKKAILERRIPELREELNYIIQMSKAGKGGGGSGGGGSYSGGGDGGGTTGKKLTPAYGQADDALTRQGQFERELQTLKDRGKAYVVSGDAPAEPKKTIRVRVIPHDGTLVFRFGDGSKVVHGKYFENGKSKPTSIPPAKATAMQFAQDDWNDLQNKYSTAKEEVTRTQTGITIGNAGSDPLAQYSIGTF